MFGNKRNTFWEIRFLPWKFGWDKVLESPRSFSVHCSSLPLNWVFGWRLWSQNFMPSSQPWFRGIVRLYQTWMHKGLPTYQHSTNTVHSRSHLKGKQVLFANVMNEHCNQLYTYPGMFRGRPPKMLPSEGGKLTNYAEMLSEVSIVEREALCKHLWVDQALL